MYSNTVLLIRVFYGRFHIDFYFFSPFFSLSLISLLLLLVYLLVYLTILPLTNQTMATRIKIVQMLLVWYQLKQIIPYTSLYVLINGAWCNSIITIESYIIVDWCNLITCTWTTMLVILLHNG